MRQIAVGSVENSRRPLNFFDPGSAPRLAAAQKNLVSVWLKGLCVQVRALGAPLGPRALGLILDLLRWLPGTLLLASAPPYCL